MIKNNIVGLWGDECENMWDDWVNKIFGFLFILMKWLNIWWKLLLPTNGPTNSFLNSKFNFQF